MLIDALERAREATSLDLVFSGLVEQIERQTKSKPEEPTLCGAVIRDRDGELWSHVDRDDHGWRRHDDDGGWRPWDEIDAVEVLFEGVEK